MTENSHGWIGTETVATRLGDFEFANSYPVGDAAQRLKNTLVFNRAVEAYLVQMPSVSDYCVWTGVASAGSGMPNQVVIWETLMDSVTLLLTGNTETVYALAAIDLMRDGPVVVEVPPTMLGTLGDLTQHTIVDIGVTGVDRGNGGKFLALPPDYDGEVPDGYFIARSPSYGVVLGLRGFQVDGKPDEAVALMKQIRIYPLTASDNPPETMFVNGSGQEIVTVFDDTAKYFDDLAALIEREPSDLIADHERFQLAAIGIEKGKPFEPDAARRKVLDDAARFASAVARANSFASDDEARLVYPDRRWEWAFIGGSATWDSQGYVNTDRRAGFAYIAIGMSPAMVDKHVGAGSQYLWTPRDASGAFLDGGSTYRLHIPANIPAKNFWSVAAYDADSRSLLRSDQRFPSVSTYTNAHLNADGSIDVHFGPHTPTDTESNWIQTVTGKGWFTLFRFYGPLEPFFDQTWKPGDIELVNGAPGNVDAQG
jgi:hypothetical protein